MPIRFTFSLFDWICATGSDPNPNRNRNPNRNPDLNPNPSFHPDIFLISHKTACIVALALGNSAMVARLTLDQVVEVRILLPQP